MMKTLDTQAVVSQFHALTNGLFLQENILQKVVMTAFADRTVVTIAVSPPVASPVCFFFFLGHTAGGLSKPEHGESEAKLEVLVCSVPIDAVL